MDNMFYNNLTIYDIIKNLLNNWKRDPEGFNSLRNRCGSYVTDAVMAVLLGGIGTSKPEHKAYISTVFKRMDVSSWKANAGLKKNDAQGYTNYQQRGFFNFPEVDNKRLKADFPSDTKIGEVCNIINNYPKSCFRNNRANFLADPKENFISTLEKIIDYEYNGNINNDFEEQPFSISDQSVQSLVTDVEPVKIIEDENVSAENFKSDNTIAEKLISDNYGIDYYSEKVADEKFSVHEINDDDIETDEVPFQVYSENSHTEPENDNFPVEQHHTEREAEIKNVCNETGDTTIEPVSDNCGNEYYSAERIGVGSDFQEINADEFEFENGIIKHKPTNKIYEDRPIDLLELSTNSYNCLRRAGIEYISDLLKRLNEISGIRNFGKKSINETMLKLALYFKIDFKEISNKKISEVNENNSVLNNLLISEMDISVRAANCLRRTGIFDLEQLMKLTYDEIVSIRNAGEKTIKEIIGVQKEYRNKFYEESNKNSENQLSDKKSDIIDKFLEDLSNFGLIKDEKTKYKYYLISYLTDNQVHENTYDVLYREPHMSELLKEYIIDLISKKSMSGVRKNKLFNLMPESMPENYFNDVIENLKNDKIEEISEDRYILNYMDVFELLEKINEKDENINVLKKRMEGYTFEEIAAISGTTRERVRQRQKKVLKTIEVYCRINSVIVREERFLPLYSKYSTDIKLFTVLTGEKQRTYKYWNTIKT